MTFIFMGIGAVSFIAIAVRFAAKVTVKQPEASRVE
jgi:hypothetical protein